MLRRKFIIGISVMSALALVFVPLTAGSQEGRPKGAQPGTPATQEATEPVTAFTGWDGDGPAPRTLVHSGDSTIQGGLCVGFDCASNEPMGFATIKIEENNLRIAAADSSTVSGFPTTDWQIEFNSSSSGGGSYFMVRDCGSGGAAGSVDSTCGGTPMLTIEGGADNESIHVDSAGNQGGNVGFGTANPVVDLHALSGNTPTLRLEQDNSSGFTPQSWDMAGNESNFFIRDVTNGSALPVRIEPGTASNTLYLDNNERIGIGTTSPEAELTVRDIDPTNGAFIHFNDPNAGTTLGSRNWFVGIEPNTGRFRITDSLSAATTNFDIRTGGAVELNGILIHSSDRNMKRNIEAVDTAAILDQLAGLDIATWSYIHDPDSATHLGPMAQDFAAAFGLGNTDTGIATLDADGVALAAIQALHAQNQELAASNAALAQRLAALEAALSALGAG